MEQSQADFTLTFRRLARVAEHSGEQAALLELFSTTSGMEAWLLDWRERLTRDPQSGAERARGMRAANPAFIPRNHHVEFALNAAESGDYGAFQRLLSVFSRPYEDQPEMADLAEPPQPSERVLQTFCGT